MKMMQSRLGVRLLVAIMIVLLPTLKKPAAAQQSLDVARGTTSIIVRDASSVSIDVSESSFSVLHVNNGIFGQHKANTKVSVAAQKYKRSFLSKGEFTPALQLEHKQVFGFPPDALGGAVDLFWGARLDWADVNYASYTDDTNTVLDLDHHAAFTATPTLGLNWFTGGGGLTDFTLGVALEGRFGWNSPGIRTPRTTCKDEAVGVDSTGSPIRVSKCEDRILGRPEDFVSGYGRVDLVGFRYSLAKGSMGQDTTGAMIGLIAAGSSEVRGDRKPTWSYAVGPAVFAPNYPDVILAALLLEVNDAADASGQVPEFRDRIAIRLHLGIPFKF